MNAVEIEEAISQLADQPFDPDSFPYAFLEAFGNKETTIKRLKSGSSNASDIEGGVLQRNNIHIAVCAEGDVTKTLAQLKSSPATTKAKAKFPRGASDGREPPQFVHYYSRVTVRRSPCDATPRSPKHID